VGVPLEEEPLLALDEIQGDVLRGFATSFEMLLGLRVDDPFQARAWIRTLADSVDSTQSVDRWRAARSAGAPDPLPRVLLNLAVSHRFLSALGYDLAALAGWFAVPPWVAGGLAGDTLAQGRPVGWKVGHDAETSVDLLILLGSDNQAALEITGDRLETDGSGAGLARVYRETGQVLPGGIEHFGFRDGISQPVPRGLRKAPAEPFSPRRLPPDDPRSGELAGPGRPLVWPGQFVFGYATQTEVSDHPGPIAGSTGEGADCPGWLRNGSLLVFRRLSQDVHAFRSFVQSTAPTVEASLGRPTSPEWLAASIVGRWPDGTPIALSRDAPSPKLASDPDRVNDFDFSTDGAGNLCPRMAHVRKVNPRGRTTDQGAPGNTLALQMLRRGIPFGPLYDVDPGTERGLLFLAWQTSPKHQFGVLQGTWMNREDNPEPGGSGHDLLVGATRGVPRTGTVEVDGRQAHVSALAPFVSGTGMAVLLAPSRSTLRDL
jgi:Dyp-type peroxidase family